MTDAATADSALGERGKIAGRAGIVAAGTLLSRVLGLVRDQVIAAMFTRVATDAFFIAFTLPNVLRQVLAEGAVQSAVLPVLASTREREGDAAARRFFASVRGLSLTLLTLTSIAGVLFAPQLVELFASGYRETPGQFERTVWLTRWVFPYIFFMGTAALGMAALNTHKRFVATSFAPGLLNLAFIACALLLPGWLATRGSAPEFALALAVLVGGVLQVVAQWPSLLRIGYLGRPRLDLGDPGVREVLRRMLPVLAGMGVYYVDVVLARRFLSELGVGAQSYFSWALRLCDFPQGIFVMALQTAALPSLARLAAREDHAEFATTFAFGMRLALFIAIPATALCVALAEPLVVLLFQRGEFDHVSAHETARALIAQGSGIWLVAAVRQLVSAYYALGDTKTPARVAAIDLGAFVLAALALRGPWGHVGVSAAVSVASAVQAALLWIWLRPRLGRQVGAELFGSFAKTAFSAGFAAATVLGVLRVVHFTSPVTEALLGAPLFVVAFLAAARLVRSEELLSLLALVQRKLRRAG
ncbi:MAG: murein biosynthesis integral membrane protein MurJ [Myxococcota bacterium]